MNTKLLLLIAAPALALLPTTGALATAQADAAQPPVAAHVDPRVELVSIVFRLAGHPEYNQARVANYAQAVEEQFRPFEEHAVVLQARELRRTRGVSYDACMSFAIHLEPELGQGVTLRASHDSLERRWPDDLDDFLADLDNFYHITEFQTFFDRHRELYTEAEQRLDAVLVQADMTWFDRFFGARAPASFELAIGLLNGGANYGPHVDNADGTRSFHCVLGAWKTDDAGLPIFDTSMLSTVVHEFCHSYCNPYVDAHLDELEGALSKLWPAVEERMRRQAYSNWQTMGRESLVRASVARYLGAQNGPEAARKHALAQVDDRGFLWTVELVELLGEYEADRELYPTFDAFVPLVIEFFDEYADARVK